MNDAIQTFAKLDSGFYVFNSLWLLVTSALVFHFTAMVYEAKKITAPAFLIGPLTICMSSIIPYVIFHAYKMRYHFGVEFIWLCAGLTISVWLIPFFCSRYRHVSGKRARAIAAEKQYSEEITRIQAHYYWLMPFIDWDRMEEEFQRHKESSDGKRSS
jgi:hypothetical protein